MVFSLACDNCNSSLIDSRSINWQSNSISEIATCSFFNVFHYVFSNKLDIVIFTLFCRKKTQEKKDYKRCLTQRLSLLILLSQEYTCNGFSIIFYAICLMLHVAVQLAICHLVCTEKEAVGYWFSFLHTYKSKKKENEISASKTFYMSLTSMW